jgi:hypothetical protein
VPGFNNGTASKPRAVALTAAIAGQRNNLFTAIF